MPPPRVYTFRFKKFVILSRRQRISRPRLFCGRDLAAAGWSEPRTNRSARSALSEILRLRPSPEISAKVCRLLKAAPSPLRILPQRGLRAGFFDSKSSGRAQDGLLGPHLHPHRESDFACANSLSDLRARKPGEAGGRVAPANRPPSEGAGRFKQPGSTGP
jgi:hypothetical protein